MVTPVIPAGSHVRWPVLGEDERRAVLGVLDRGVLSGQLAPEVRGLEREFAAFVGVAVSALPPTAAPRRCTSR